ncbi:hypothetical protein ACFLXT_02015 [Chloroflexota bacterium]
MADGVQERIAEYSAMRHEMQSITVARYTVLAITMTAIAAILSLVPLLTQDQIYFMAPISIAAIMLPSIMVNLTLSMQFHRLSTFNSVFFKPPEFIQESAWDKYASLCGGYWGYVKPLALTYLFLLVGSVVVFIILFWCWQILLGMGLVFVIGMVSIVFLWNASVSGKWRKRDIERWEKVKEELSKNTSTKI